MTEMGDVAAPAEAAASTLAPPEEQLRRLAVELRLLLPRVRGELTLGTSRALLGLERSHAGRPGLGEPRIRFPKLCLSPFSVPLMPHPSVGEARGTLEEFNRELFWRRLSECPWRRGPPPTYSPTRHPHPQPSPHPLGAHQPCKNTALGGSVGQVGGGEGGEGMHSPGSCSSRNPWAPLTPRS